MANNGSFLDQLNEQSASSEILNHLKNNKELFYSQLIEKWAVDILDSLKKDILKEAQNGNFAYEGDKRVVSGKCRVGSSLIAWEYRDISKQNTLFAQEIKENNLEKIFVPKATFEGYRTETVKTGYLFYKDKRRYSCFKLSLCPLAQRAIQVLNGMANKDFICITQIALYDFHSTIVIYGENVKKTTERFCCDDDSYEEQRTCTFPSYTSLEISYRIRY